MFLKYEVIGRILLNMQLYNHTLEHIFRWHHCQVLVYLGINETMRLRCFFENIRA